MTMYTYMSGLCTVCHVCLVWVLHVMFVWSGCYMSCLSGLGVICLVCLGCLSSLPTSYTASVLGTCIPCRCVLINGCGYANIHVPRVSPLCVETYHSSYLRGVKGHLEHPCKRAQ